MLRHLHPLSTASLSKTQAILARRGRGAKAWAGHTAGVQSEGNTGTPQPPEAAGAPSCTSWYWLPGARHREPSRQGVGALTGMSFGKNTGILRYAAELWRLGGCRALETGTEMGKLHVKC